MFFYLRSILIFHPWMRPSWYRSEIIVTLLCKNLSNFEMKVIFLTGVVHVLIGILTRDWVVKKWRQSLWWATRNVRTHRHHFPHKSPSIGPFVRDFFVRNPRILSKDNKNFAPPTLSLPTNQRQLGQPLFWIFALLGNSRKVSIMISSQAWKTSQLFPLNWLT